MIPSNVIVLLLCPWGKNSGDKKSQGFITDNLIFIHVCVFHNGDNRVNDDKFMVISYGRLSEGRG